MSPGAAGTCAGRFSISRAGRGMTAVPAKAGRSGGWSCTSGSPGGFLCVIVVVCEGVDLLRQKVMRLIGVVGAVVSLMDRLVADRADLVVMFAGGLADFSGAVEGVDHLQKTGFQNVIPLAEAFDHVFKGLAGFHHRQVIILLSDQALGLADPAVDLFPGALTCVSCCSHRHILLCI